MRIVHLLLVMHMFVSTSMAQSTTQPRHRLLVYRARGHVVAIVWISDAKTEKIVGNLSEDEKAYEEVFEHDCDDVTFRSSLSLLKVWQANPSPPPLDVLASAINRSQGTKDASSLGSEPVPAVNPSAADRHQEETAENPNLNSLIGFQYRTMAAEEHLLSAITVRRPDFLNSSQQHDLNELSLRRQLDFQELDYKHDRLQDELESNQHGLRNDCALNENLSAERFSILSHNAHKETVEGVKEKAGRWEAEVKQVVLALLPVIASHGLSAPAAPDSAPAGKAGVSSTPAPAGKMPVPSPANRTHTSADEKIPANSSGMSPVAERFAEHLAALPNATDAKTGKPVNANGLSLPWPQQELCEYLNDCGGPEPSFGLDDLIPIGRVGSLFRSRTVRPVWQTRTVSRKGSSFVEEMVHGEAARYDKYWQKYAPEQISPGNRRLDFKIFSGRTGRTESSRVVYDEFGRQSYRVDFTDHLRPLDHSSPHLHERQYGPGFSPYHESLHNLNGMK